MKYLSLIALTLAISATSYASMPEVTEDEAKNQTTPAPSGETSNSSSATAQQDDSNKKKPCVIL